MRAAKKVDLPKEADLEKTDQIKSIYTYESIFEQ